MQALVGGSYTAGLAVSKSELQAAFALRSLVFRAGTDDRDDYDAACDHMVVTDVTGAVIACARVLFLTDGALIDQSYAAQFYDLERLRRFNQPLAELGRFCVHPDHSDGDVLRVIWGALTQYVDARGVQMLFGCTSFTGASVSGREAALGYLAGHHLAPEALRPGIGFDHTVDLLALRDANVGRGALQSVPPLLRTYLTMGAWISDHAVVDTDLDTLHVFTGLEISKIPDSRKRVLRALGGTKPSS